MGVIRNPDKSVRTLEIVLPHNSTKNFCMQHPDVSPTIGLERLQVARARLASAAFRSEWGIDRWAWITHDRDEYTVKDFEKWEASREGRDAIAYDLATAEKQGLAPTDPVKLWPFEVGTYKPVHDHLALHLAKDAPQRTARVLVVALGWPSDELPPMSTTGLWDTTYVPYLIHANASAVEAGKHHYKVEDVHGDTKTLARLAGLDLFDVERLIDAISSGEIRRYNLQSFPGLTVHEYIANKRRIELAFDYRREIDEMELGRSAAMKRVFWVYGSGGTGKTLFAERQADKSGDAWYITPTGKNKFDEYKGQPTIIYDDARPDELPYSDLLGILDPYNFRHLAARYVNRVMMADTVYITTPFSPSEYIDALELKPGDDPNQLYRRILGAFYVSPESVRVEMVNSDGTTEVVKVVANSGAASVKKVDKRQVLENLDIV